MNTFNWTTFRAKSLPFRKSLANVAGTVLLYSGLLTLFVIIYDIGFPEDLFSHEEFSIYYQIYIRIGVVCYAIKSVLNIWNRDKKLKLKVIDLMLFLGFLVIFFWLVKGYDFGGLNNLRAHYRYVLVPFSLIAIATEFFRNLQSYYLRNINPALIFVLFFLLLILAGAGFLLLPNATHDRISFTDALFTSSSAVCITGLAVVDTAHVFTRFGHAVLMILMQLGGLGIMTFAGFVGHMFSSGISFQQQMMMREQVSGENLSQVIKSVYKIILITLLVESLGGVFIFLTTLHLDFPDMGERIFFAAFHTVSAFCNAGFSTVENGLYHPDFRFNYPLQLVIAFLFLFGGIGFPIVFNFYNNIKLFIRNSFQWIWKGSRFHHVPNAISFNSKLMLWTTTILLVLSFALFFFMEYDASLKEFPLTGKIVQSFFMAASTRSSGFHSLDMSLLTFPTIMIFLLMMWVGASPGGTGGGIRTTTFAVATLNFWQTAKGRDRITIWGREIPQASIRRAFAIISLSIIMMGISTFIIYSFDGHLSMVNILFDVFSAFNNCGLSLGITPELSDKSKFVLTLTMFIGRVSALTLLSAFIYKKQFQNIRYPTQDILY